MTEELQRIIGRLERSLMERLDHIEQGLDELRAAELGKTTFRPKPTNRTPRHYQRGQTRSATTTLDQGQQNGQTEKASSPALPVPVQAEPRYTSERYSEAEKSEDMALVLDLPPALPPRPNNLLAALPDLGATPRHPGDVHPCVAPAAVEKGSPAPLYASSLRSKLHPCGPLPPPSPHPPHNQDGMLDFEAGLPPVSESCLSNAGVAPQASHELSKDPQGVATLHARSSEGGARDTQVQFYESEVQSGVATPPRRHRPSTYSANSATSSMNSCVFAPGQRPFIWAQQAHTFAVTEQWESTAANGMFAQPRLRAQNTRTLTDLMSGDINDVTDAIKQGRCVIGASSKKRLTWDILGMVLITYDMLTIPVQFAFEPQQSDGSLAMFWVCMMFWTTDIFMSFVTSRYVKGQEVRSIPLIAKGYFQTWFALDVAIVANDWVTVFGDQASRGIAPLARLGKAVRMLRVLRTLRLLRLVKLRKTMDDIIDRINSEYFHVCMDMMKLIMLILAINHLIACGWYLSGRLTVDAYGDRTWIRDGHFEEWHDLSYRYLTSLHWSLTQFTPASMEVVPRNKYERGYAVSVLIFALLVFSSFLSSITASMTQLRKILFDNQMALLRRFLRNREISHSLTERVMQYAAFKQKQRKTEIQEGDVLLLKSLSKPLQMALKQEMYRPMLFTHPFFFHENDAGANLAECCSGALQSICSTAISSMAFAQGDIVFAAGQRDDTMFLLRSGKMLYTQRAHASSASFDDLGSTEPLALTQRGDWCCEAALWTEWVHCGTMFSPGCSDVITIEAGKFADAIKEHNRVVPAVCRYAQCFVEDLNKKARRGALSDLEPSELVHDDNDDGETEHEDEKASVPAMPQGTTIWKISESTLVDIKERVQQAFDSSRTRAEQRKPKQIRERVGDKLNKIDPSKLAQMPAEMAAQTAAGIGQVTGRLKPWRATEGASATA